MHIVLGGNYPTWLKEGQLVKVLATLPWVQTVSNFKRGTALDINGIDVTFRQAPCCGFCGWDSHIQLDCEYLQRFTSDVGPVFRARSLQGKDVKEAIVETHLNKLFFSHKLGHYVSVERSVCSEYGLIHQRHY
jgi:hypothetical protein